MATNFYYNPYRAINELQQQMQRIWQESEQGEKQQSACWSPVVDIYETENELVLLSELPGVAENDFHLSAENNVLTLSGERKFDTQKYKIYRQERPTGTFQRSFSLPANFELGSISANFKDGILRVTLPKKAAARPRQIPVKAK